MREAWLLTRRSLSLIALTSRFGHQISEVDIQEPFIYIVHQTSYGYGTSSFNEVGLLPIAMTPAPRKLMKAVLCLYADAVIWCPTRHKLNSSLRVSLHQNVSSLTSVTSANVELTAVLEPILPLALNAKGRLFALLGIFCVCINREWRFHAISTRLDFRKYRTRYVWFGRQCQCPETRGLLCLQTCRSQLGIEALW